MELWVEGKSLHLQKDEFTMSKDLPVRLWMDYRTYYGASPLREVLEGDFVIFNDDLYDEFTCSFPWMVLG